MTLEDKAAYARILKVTACIETLLQGCDAELMPWDVWYLLTQQVNQVQSYLNNSLTQYLPHINNSLDNSLKAIAPYTVQGKGAVIAASKAAKKAQGLLKDIQKYNDKIYRLNDYLENLKNEIEKYKGEQEAIYEGLREKIESLLPGVASVGMAKVFKESANKLGFFLNWPMI